MHTILVTGGAGFIGSCFIRQLLNETTTRVINLDKLTYAGNPDSIPDADPTRYSLVHGDIADAQKVTQILTSASPTAIVNFAAESHVDRSIDGPGEFIQTNVVGTFRLLDATLEWWKSQPESEQAAFRFLHVSTDEVYGSLGPDGAFSETTAYAPNSPYSASKAASDHLVRAWHHTYGLPVVTTNCSNNYGPYQFPEKLIPLMTLSALDGKPLPVYGDGMNIRDWLYVDDHCRAIRTVLQSGRTGEVYNIGGNSECTNLTVVHTLCDLLDEFRPRDDGASYREQITFVTDRPGHDRRYAIDCSKLMNELNWRPAESFASGLRKTVEWYLTNDTWIENVTSGKYRQERLGLGEAQ